jgi:hypothetical protein
MTNINTIMSVHQTYNRKCHPIKGAFFFNSKSMTEIIKLLFETLFDNIKKRMTNANNIPEIKMINICRFLRVHLKEAFNTKYHKGI